MGLISLLVMLMIVGLLEYLIETTIPMAPQFKTILRAVVVIVVILWLVQLFFGDIAIPRLRTTAAPGRVGRMTRTL